MGEASPVSFGFGNQLVRAIDRDGSAWFVGNDVCAALELANTSHALGRLDVDERDEVAISDPIGRQQQTTIISESGVYSLTFTSRKEAAKRFKRWVTSEVLPALRRTGEYRIAEPAISPVFTQAQFETIDAVQKIASACRWANLYGGKPAARRLWAMLGGPDVFGEDAAARVVAADPTVTTWFGERVERTQGGRTPTAVLYRDYLDWCMRAERRVMNISSFGKHLGWLGVAKKMSDGSQSIDVRLRPMGEYA